MAQRLPVLYDPDCGLCSATARMLRRLDGAGRLELVPFDEAERRGLGAELPRDRFYGSFHAVAGGDTVSGADAIPLVLERLPLGRGPARLIRRSAFLEGVVARAYDWVSRHRHATGCRCHSPTPSKG